MAGFYKRLIGNSVFANVILISLVALGLVAVSSIRRESNPDISLPAIDVRVPYPGADPEEVEEGVSQKIEAAVDGLQGIKRYFTTSQEGMSRLQIEVSQSFDTGEVLDRVRNAVESIETFPEGAEKPRVTQDQNREEVVDVMVWGALSERELKELAEEIRNELQDLPEVSLVEVYNTRPYEIAVEVSEERLRANDLSLSDISQAIQDSSLNRSAGSLQLKGEEIRIRALGKKYLGREFESVVVKAEPGGEVITLGQVAEIRDGFDENETYTSFNGQPAVLVMVMKSPGDDTIAISDAVAVYAEAKQATLPPGVYCELSFDSTEFIRSQLSLIGRNGLLGLGLVLLVLWVFLEARLAFWVALGIPISLAGGVLLLWLMGASLNQISLIAMIVVMGIIVDDAIVVGEAVYVHRRMGKDPLQAAVDGVREVGLPVFASVSTTIMAFLPMAFISGFFGDFMRQMPLVVIAALSVSLLECLFLLPAHLKHRLEKENKVSDSWRYRFHLKERIARGLERFVESVYGPVVRVAVRYRYVTLCFGMSLILLTAGVIGGGHIKVIMWPAIESDFLRAYVEFPPGTPMETVRDGVRQTREGIERVSARMETKSGDPLLVSVLASAPYDLDTQGRVMIQVLPTGERGVLADDVLSAWREEIGAIPGALHQSFEGDSIGTGGGSDVDYWLQGPDLEVLREAAGELKAKIAQYAGVYQIADNLRPGTRELHVSLKPAAHNLGLTLDDVSRHLHAGYYGDEALRLQRGREDVRVQVRYPREERRRLSDFEDVRVRTPEGYEVPLRSVAALSYQEGVSNIAGYNGVRGVNVTASVDRAAAVPSEINSDLIDHYMAGLVAKYPGVTWSLFGAEEQNREVMASLGRNTIIALLGVFIILCTIFRSYLQPVIIMLIIPYGFVGAVVGHMIMGLPLSFLSMFGIVALAGVLVNDSIVLIERVNTFLARGVPLQEAVCLGGKRRFRAIFLTSVSTVAGLTPMIVETDLMAQIVIPMAVSLASGVACGTMLTLVLIPAFLVIMNDARRAAFRLRKGYWPTAEEVEPGTYRETTSEAEFLEPAVA